MKIFRKMPLFILIVVFAAAFSVADLLTPDRNFSESENRYLAGPPAVTLPTIINGSFSEGYETYISDQFLFREGFITLKSAFETALMKTENNDIIYGRNGNLFPKFSKFESRVLQANLAAIDKFAAAMKAPVAVMILPSKYHPLIDTVPLGFPFVDQSYFISGINGYLSVNADVVNAKDILTVNSSRYIYYRTDHHWTNYGAWLAYQQFASVAGFAPFEYDSRPMISVEGFLGTSYSKSHRLGTKPDVITYYDFEIESLIADGVEYSTLYDFEQFGKRDKYAGFIHGNNGLTVIQSEYSDSKLGAILVIKDSFANSLIPLLTEHYNTIYAIDPRFYNYAEGYSQFAEMDLDQVLIAYSFETLAAPSSINFIALDFED